MTFVRKYAGCRNLHDSICCVIRSYHIAPERVIDLIEMYETLFPLGCFSVFHQMGYHMRKFVEIKSAHTVVLLSPTESPFPNSVIELAARLRFAQ